MAVILERSGLARIQTLVACGGKIWDMLYVSTVRHPSNYFIVSLSSQCLGFIVEFIHHLLDA